MLRRDNLDNQKWVVLLPNPKSTAWTLKTNRTTRQKPKKTMILDQTDLPLRLPRVEVISRVTMKKKKWQTKTKTEAVMNLSQNAHKAHSQKPGLRTEFFLFQARNRKRAAVQLSSKVTKRPIKNEEVMIFCSYCGVSEKHIG